MAGSHQLLLAGGAGLPTAPTTVTATVTGQTTVSVAFSGETDGGSAITSYTVTSSPGNITGTGSSSPITVSGLTADTAYTFTVVATNIVGSSPASNASASVTTQRGAGTFSVTQAAALSSYVVNDIISISYTGGEQTILQKNATAANLVALGAAGAGFGPPDQGGGTQRGGHGGRATGTLNWNTVGGPLYVHVGGGGGSSTGDQDVNGGYNGGGFAPGSGNNPDNRNGSGGGGTDFRIVSGAAQSGPGLNSRILVAGGGGGTNAWGPYTGQTAGAGGYGGGSVGGTGIQSGSSPGSAGGGGTQNSGGSAGGGTTAAQAGGFGFGGAGGRINTSDPSGPGGGGGWYGGGGGASQAEASAGGGSGYFHPSYISSGILTDGTGTQGVAAQWSVNNQGNGVAQVTITAVS
jgi:hypothetical protein